MFYLTFLVGGLSSYLGAKKHVLSWLFLGILGVLAFFRYGLGADYFAYQYLYNRLAPSVITELGHGLDGQEPLFRALGSIMRSLGFPYQLYLSVLTTIQLGFIYKIAREYSYYPTMSLFLYYCFYYLVWTFSGLRQGLVLAIGMWYLLELMHKETSNKKDIGKFLFLVVILTTIHMSALILIPFYISTRITLRKSTVAFVLLAGIAVNFVPVWPMLVRLLPGGISFRLSPYVGIFSATNVLDFASFARLIFAIIVFLYWNKLVEEQGLPQGVIQLYLVSISLYFVFKFSELVAARLSIYGMILNIVIFPNILYSYKKRFNKLVFGVLLLVLCSLYFAKELDTLERQTGLIKQSGTLITPYVSIFDKTKHTFGNRYFILLN